MPLSIAPRRAHRRRAVAVHEVLVGSVVVALLVAALLPCAARMRRVQGDAISFANLQLLAAAHATYAADWDERQVTWTPDNLGVVGGNCPTYINTFGCPPPVLLGNDMEGDLWGYFLGCGGYPGSCANWINYKPVTYNPLNVFGTFRMCNAKAFQPYVDGHFYSVHFYTPEDFKTWEKIKPALSVDAEYVPLPPSGGVVFASYALSPPAMLDPGVLALNPATGKHWKSPDTFATGYTSPGAEMAAHPELKTRMIEHNWCSDPPSQTNPNFSGMTPWFFNHGIAATPVALFYDGSVAEIPNAQVVEDDQKVLNATGTPLWSRDTPLGANGYYGLQSFDGTIVSHHILTIDGILGRDRLMSGPRSRDAR